MYHKLKKEVVHKRFQRIREDYKAYEKKKNHIEPSSNSRLNNATATAEPEVASSAHDMRKNVKSKG